MWEITNTIKEPIIKIYPYGSRVYGTANEKSDYDFMAIAQTKDTKLDYTFECDNVSVHVVSEYLFIKRIKEHHISYLECIFQDPDDEYRKHFKLDLEKLRRNVSAISSNSFVKCKKKMIDGEPYIGKKSMFHSIRIVQFGCQIAKYGEIVDYKCANVYYDRVMSFDNWEDIKEDFQPRYNRFKSTLRELAPLESDQRRKG
ncbi:nucleotidyltransferase [Bacillus phage vB_BanS_Sophrita]|uniref:Nucleotidyltransferase n=1 Tax=Bacillus phage vB_BanS_Sophrita TaxID=2894790 RepID=A0AAE8YU13_9CAUD|nr:nucleotidyltransferase [Bacillus phage vB_BanS_Sophrita]UGO50750.1 putative nucleotidyltransferase [Bacillus phage vB_BanS_Sophrita]